MFLFLLNVLFGILCFFLLKSLRLLLFLLFMNRILPHLTPLKLFPIAIIPLIIVLYFPSITIIFLTILVTTILYNSLKNPILTESHPKKLILYFPMILLVFSLYFLHNLLFSSMKTRYFMALLMIFDALFCSFYRFFQAFLNANFDENFGILLNELPEIDNIQEIHKRNLMKFISHLDNFADILQKNSINTLPVLMKRFYKEKLAKIDLKYLYYAEKTLFIGFLLLITAFCKEKHRFEQVFIEIMGVLHIDWLSLSLNSSGENSLKKSCFMRVFLMVLYKFFLAFSLGFTNFSIGYFVFFTIETLILLNNLQETMKFSMHMACGFIFLMINQRITHENVVNSRVLQINTGIFLANLSLLLIKFIKDKKNSVIFDKNFGVFSEFFMQEKAIFISIFVGFSFTYDFFMAFQWIFILIIWILMRFLYENLKLNDFHLFGDLLEIKRKYEDFSKIYHEFPQNFEIESSKKNLAVFFLYMKKHEKNLFFHQFHKVENFENWVSARFLRNSKLLITDERIFLSGIGMILSSVVMMAISKIFFGVSIKEQALFAVGIVIFLGFFAFLAYLFEKTLAKTIWEIFSYGILMLFVIFPNFYGLFEVDLFNFCASVLFTWLLTIVFVGAFILRKNHWILTDNLFTLYSNFVIVFLLFLTVLFLISPDHNLLIITMIFCLVFSEYFLYNYLNKRKLKRNFVFAFIAFYLFSLVSCAIHSKTFVKELPLIFFFCIIFFSIKTYFEFFQSLQNFNKEPIYVSPLLFPSYTYSSSTFSIKSHNQRTLNMLLSFCFLLYLPLYQSTPTLCFTFFITISFILTLFLTQILYIFFYFEIKFNKTLHETPHFQKDFLNKAWISVTKAYLTRQNARTLEDLIDYKAILKELNTLKNTIESSKELKEFNVIDSSKIFVKAAISQSAKQMEIVIEDEKRLIEEFKIFAFLEIKQEKINEKARFVKFIEENQEKLEEKGCIFSLEGLEKKKPVERYQVLQKIFKKFDENQKKAFESQYSQYVRSLRQLSSLEKLEVSASLSRKEKLYKSLSQIVKTKLFPIIKPAKAPSSTEKSTEITNEITKEITKEITNEISKESFKEELDEIQQMADSPLKYQKISCLFSKTHVQFTDSQFPASPRSLGLSTLPFVSSWQRPPPNSRRFISGYSPSDVLQGALGDCYFLSALCVLGEEKTKELFISSEEEDMKIGAILLRFHINSEEFFVIIDTNFPMNSDGKWAFATSEEEGELWPMILEKAYAKAYGSYEGIIGGRVHYALSDLTGGYPEEIKTEKYARNCEVFFDLLKKYQKDGFLLGCSSLAQRENEAKCSKNGIVQGHAYAILEVISLVNCEEKLIKLRNPHGSKGVEWKGDWSDESGKWDEEMKKNVGMEVKEDGIFFMGFEDFLYEFKCAYVCRIFEKKTWRNLEKIQGEWKGENAAGLPSKKWNPNCEIGKNPQYGLKVFRKTNVFVVMNQTEAVDMFRGKLPIHFMVQKNEGKFIRNSSNKSTVGSTGTPIDMKTICADIVLEAEYYPYTFTMLVASLYPGEKGSGGYEIQIIANENVDFVTLKNE